MASDVLGNVTQIMGIGLLVGVAYVAYNTLKDAGFLDSPVPVETRTEWCETLGRNIDPSLTCPTAATPFTPVVRPECGEGWKIDLATNTCVKEYWNVPTPPPVYEPGLSGMCQWPNGDPLRVPAGMDCNQAVQQICDRFGPGYKGC